MEQIWKQEYDITASLVKQLVEDQFPTLAPVKAEYVSSGWDNAVFLINQAYIFRFPRRNVAVPLIETENKILPNIAPFIGDITEIPQPIFKGKPAKHYPCPFSGYPILHGLTPEHVKLTNKQRTGMAVQLAAFLKKLHAIRYTG